jgi:hypothetical protein
MGRACSTNREKMSTYFGEKARREETTRKTKTRVDG